MTGNVPKFDPGGFIAHSKVGTAAIRAGLDEKRAFVKEAKLLCDRCRKQENSTSPLQACTFSTFERYCSRECQVAHYKPTHKKACANFIDPPLCRAFNYTLPLPGCSYPEMPIFAKGISEGMGAWVSVAGNTDCRLVTPPREMALEGEDSPQSRANLIAMTPGMVDGKYLSLTILVQNRSTKPMVVVGLHIAAVASPRGTPLIMEGKDPGEPNCMLDYPHLNGPVLGLAKTFVELTHLNGKSLKEGGSYPAVKDTKMCAVLLNTGDYAMFTVEFRAGGPKITHDFQALELLEHIIVPAIPYDPNIPHNNSYADLLPAAADRDEVCEVRAKIDQGAVEAWFRDYKTKGELGYVASHYGEARAKMIGSSNQALVELLMLGMSSLSL
ncbi:hypothetical protein C8R46DRAFT_907074 [Mycena filopes]|nr:hypothetical protein C8R46DRAFT_907074 [Mycena filopes]